MSPLVPYLAPLVAGGVAFFVVRLMTESERLRLPLDRPNERSLHSTPTPRTGGIGVLAGIAAMLPLLPSLALPAGGALLLAGVSFLDDWKSLPAGLRLLAHFAVAAAFALVALPGLGAVTLAALVVATVWMTNLYNFMDGSDGLAGGMALFGFGAYGVAAGLAGADALSLGSFGVALAAAAFLRFNFPPARIFMGDVGSVPLGFLAAAFGALGWKSGAWPAWFPALVFSPFVVDASVTLTRRLLRGEKVWLPHRTHYYQRLVQLGYGHLGTVRLEYGAMAIAGTLAVLAARGHLPAVPVLASAAIAYGAAMLAIDRRWRRANPT